MMMPFLTNFWNRYSVDLSESIDRGYIEKLFAEFAYFPIT